MTKIETGCKMKIIAVADKGVRVGFMIWCPACEGLHVLATSPTLLPSGNTWSVDASNMDEITVVPSVDVRYSRDGKQIGRCNFLLLRGRMMFCPNSTHRLAGHTVELPHIPEGMLG